MHRPFRRRPSAALVVSMLALFAALSGWGYAATSNFVLGKTNRAKKTTGIASSAKHAPALAVTNTGGGAAGSFTVKAGVTPFTVSSSAKVVKLDADLLDGIDSSALQRRVEGTCAAGSAIRVITVAGGVTCQTVGTTVGGGGGGGTPAANTSWSFTGNAGTSTTAFLGTTDAKPLVVKTNNKEALRVDTSQNVGVGTSTPIARLEALAAPGGIGLLGTSDARGIVGRIGNGTSCPGAYAVGGCSPNGAPGVFGLSASGIGVAGQGPIGVHGRGDSQGVVGVLGNIDCKQTFAVGGCGGTTGEGVLGDSASRGVIGTLGGVSCPGTYGAGGCGGTTGDGVLAETSVPANSITAAALHAVNTAGGDIFIGQSGNTRVARIDGNGKGFFDGGTQASGADYAETMPAGSAALEPGDVLVVGPGGTVTKSSRPSSQLVTGVYSTRPAVLAVGKHGIDDSLAGQVPVALLGVVPTKVSAENGPIRAGDLLVTSRTPGYAMKAPRLVVGGVAVYPTGAILGKALEPLARGTGVIRVLVMLR
jgi:hypothetical protein